MGIICKKFKSDVTAASYKSDLSEFCRFTEKCFQETDFSDVLEILYSICKKRIKNWTDRSIESDGQKKVQGTSFFSKFLLERVERTVLEDESKTSSFKDYFEPVFETNW